MSVEEKISALLRKAESTEFEDEANTFFAKAQELMLRYAVDEASLHDAGPRASVEQEKVEIKDRDEIRHAKTRLLHKIAKANRCTTIYLKGRGASALIGTKDDRAFVLELFRSVLFQHDIARSKAWRAAPKDYYRADKGRHVFVVNFADGYVSRVGARIEENARVAEDNVGSKGTDLILSRDAELQDFVADNYGRVVAGRSSRHQTQWAAFAAGSAAGSQADISGDRNRLRSRGAIAR